MTQTTHQIKKTAVLPVQFLIAEVEEKEIATMWAVFRLHNIK